MPPPDKSPYTFDQFTHVLRVVPANAPGASALALDWQAKRELLDLQLFELPLLARAVHENPMQPHPRNPNVRLFNRAPRMRLGAIAEATANTVYSIGEVAAKLGHMLSRGQLSRSFNRLQKKAEQDPLHAAWFVSEEVRGYRKIREMRTEWTHHSSTFVADQDNGEPLIVVRGTRDRSDLVEFADHINITVPELSDWCRQSIAMYDRFAGFLLASYALAMYDQDHQLVVPELDGDGWPIVNDGRFKVRQVTVREYFQEAGIPI